MEVVINAENGIFWRVSSSLMSIFSTNIGHKEKNNVRILNFNHSTKYFQWKSCFCYILIFQHNCGWAKLPSFEAVYREKNAIFDYKRRFLQKLHRWIWAFCSHIGLCIVHLHFLCGMNLQISTIAVRMHFFMFYMRICAYFGVRFMSIGVEFVQGTKRTFKRNLFISSSLH